MMSNNSISNSKDDEEILKLKEQIAQFQKENDVAKQECKELKEMVKNSNVVLKEFSKSYEDQKKVFQVVEAELAELKEQLAIKQKDYDQRADQLKLFREVLDTKRLDIEQCTEKVKKLKETIRDNTLRLQTLKLTLDEKQFKEWYTLLDDLKHNQKSLTRSMIVKNKVEESISRYDGIPDACRGSAWQLMSPFYALKAKQEDPGQLYFKLLEKQNKWEKVIEKDIHRTFPNHEFYSRMKEGNKLDSLYNVLKAYSNWDPGLGYCQGMNFVVALLLIYMDQESAFWMLLVIMQYYKMVGLFDKGPMLQYFLSHFDNELRMLCPSLYAHLREERVNSVMYCTEWFTTMFVYSLPIETTARIWDIFFFGDGPQVLFRVALALLKIYEESILQRSMEDILTLLKKKSRHVSPSLLISTAQSIKLSSTTLDFLKAIEVEWQQVDGVKRLVSYVKLGNGLYA